jgi:hypothetical protein
VVHSNVRKGIARLLKDLTSTSGKAVTRDGYISRITLTENDNNERIEKHMVVDLHLCKAHAVKWTTPVPAECSMTFNEACSDDNGFAVLTQLEKELLAQCPPAWDYLSPPGQLTIMVRSLLLVIQEGALTIVDISDPILLRDLAKGKWPSMGEQSQAFNRDSMYSSLIKVGILTRLALMEELDPALVRTLVGMFVG